MTGLVVVILLLLLATATAVVVFRDLTTTVVAFGVYSLGMAMLWAVFRAPDVALTEAAVGAGVTTAVFLVVAFKTGSVEPGTFRSLSDVDPLAALTAAGVVAGLLWTVPALPTVGDPDAPAFAGVAPEFLARSPEFGIANVVTAVLVVFRGFDTFGEVVVVFAAGVAVLVALDREVVG